MSLEYGDSVEILTSMITLIWEERKQTITANLTLKKEFKSFCVLVTDKGESPINQGHLYEYELPGGIDIGPKP